VNYLILATTVILGAAPALAVETRPELVGKTFELSAGDDPVEAFAQDGISVAGASYEVKSGNGTRFRVDRAAAGRQGLVIVSKVTKELKSSRAQWQVIGFMATAVDSDDAFTSNCKVASAADVNFLYYTPDKGGAAIKRPEAGFHIDGKSGKIEPVKLTASECRPGKAE
jgi:hypothetical protein